MTARILVPWGAGAAPRSVCVLQGSLDPPHLGHQWMVRQLLARSEFDAVLLLVPARHFEKSIRPPRNATLPQRLAMLSLLYSAPGSGVALGVAQEVLFLRLARGLSAQLGGARISFGMGDDTYAKLLDSGRYYARRGLAWGAAQQRELQQLCQRVVVFGRSTQAPALAVPVPARVRHISSTLVRQNAASLHASGASAARWADQLGRLVATPVWRYVRRQGLYRCG